MMDPTLNGGTMVGEQALMNALESLQVVESENEQLKRENATLKDAAGIGQNSANQMDELLAVNHQWDLEYKEQEEAFRRYRFDSQQAQSENQSYIASLKQDKDGYLQEIETLRYELDQTQKKLKSVRHRNQALEEQLGVGNRHHGNQGASPQRVKQLEEDNALLKQQLTAYKEDFEAERRDRERLTEEKQSAALRYDAEITSLKLQLDRCRNELTHYTTESTRLAQQLRLKNQYEEDQYKKHLESRGYVSRSPNGALPPLDPFVEHDPPSYNPRQKYLPPHSAPPIPKVIEPYTNGPVNPPRTNSPRVTPRQRGGQLLARSSDSDMDSHSAPASFGPEQHPTSTSQSDYDSRHSKTPSPTHRRISAQGSQFERAIQYSGQNGVYPPAGNYSNQYPNPAQGYPQPTHPNNSSFKPALSVVPRTNQSVQHASGGSGYIMQNGGVVPPAYASNASTSHNVTPSPLDGRTSPRDKVTNGSTASDFVVINAVGYDLVQSDGEHRHTNSPANNSSPVAKNRIGHVSKFSENGVRELNGQVNGTVQKLPPMQTKGRHKCPRCARRFGDSSECADHKARCIS